MSKCVEITPPFQRLNCFDTLAGKTNTDNLTSSKKSKDKWSLSESSDPINDTKSIMLTLKSQEDEKTSMNIRCRNNKAEFFIYWDRQVAVRETFQYEKVVKVSTRIGSEDAFDLLWNPSTNNIATFYPSNTVNEFIHKLMNNDTLTFRVGDTLDENKITRIFNIKDIDKQITPIKEACHLE
jgi:hypothetical protein